VRKGLIIGVGTGFQILLQLGLVPNGEIGCLNEGSPVLAANSVGRHVSTISQTKVVSVLSPWFSMCEVGEVHSVAVSAGKGRFIVDTALFDTLAANGQIAAQFVDFSGNASMDVKFNPCNSAFAVEAVTSIDGRILGKVGHTERYAKGLFKNVPGNYEQRIFEAGVKYYK